jgi:hypothetical protein
VYKNKQQTKGTKNITTDATANNDNNNKTTTTAQFSQ